MWRVRGNLRRKRETRGATTTNVLANVSEVAKTRCNVRGEWEMGISASSVRQYVPGEEAENSDAL